MNYPQIILHSGREQSLLRRHQWIFSKAIKRMDKSVGDGDVVHICDQNGKILATGHYQDSSLSLRILSFDEQNIDAAFWRQKLQSAVSYRKALSLLSSDSTTACRLVHGEGDELPGLIVDVYQDIAVIQAHSIGMYRERDAIAKAIMELEGLAVKAVYDKSGDLLQHPSVSDTATKWLSGIAEPRVVVTENNLSFLVDFAQGQKTGFFIDQRDNRMLVKMHAQGKRVLNCFCYTGGFSIYALSGGAAHVTSIDTSAPALSILEENLGLNQCTEHHQTIAADVMQYLKESTDTYDLVVCDPPAFAKSIHKRHNAVQAYKRLNVMAMKRVRPGGMLFTFSCSQVVDRQLFHDTIVAAAIEVGRPIRIMFEMHQGPDHPVSIFHPEGNYLKGLALCIE